MTTPPARDGIRWAFRATLPTWQAAGRATSGAWAGTRVGEQLLAFSPTLPRTALDRCPSGMSHDWMALCGELTEEGPPRRQYLSTLLGAGRADTTAQNLPAEARTPGTLGAGADVVKGCTQIHSCQSP